MYGGALVAGQTTLAWVRPDGTAVDLPPLRVRQGGYRFLPDSKGLVFQPSGPSPDFWLLDLAAKTTRRLTHLSDQRPDTDIRHHAGRESDRVRPYPAEFGHRPDRPAEVRHRIIAACTRTEKLQPRHSYQPTIWPRGTRAR